jgi:hypothetical protein
VNEELNKDLQGQAKDEEKGRDGSHGAEGVNEELNKDLQGRAKESENAIADFAKIEKMKDFIRKAKRHGDVAAVGKHLKCSDFIYRSAMGRTDDDYTDAEMMFLKEMYVRTSRRMDLREELGLNNDFAETE